MNRTRSRHSRWAAPAAVALAAALMLTACSSKPLDVVAGSGTATSPTSAGPAAGGGGAVAAPGHPLIAEDLPGWADVELPGWAALSLVQPCGEPTGLRDLQSAVRPAALTTPTGITVLNQVADYASSDPVAAINDTLAAALLSCPAYDTGTHTVSVRALPGPAGQTTVGAEVTRTEVGTGLREVTVYWAALTGAQTVEVSVIAQLGAVGAPPLEQFGLDLLAAAQAKARGERVPAVQAPALPQALTTAEENAARAELEAARAQTDQAGLDAETNALLSQEEADRRAAEQAAAAVPASPAGGAGAHPSPGSGAVLEHGIDGVGGPNVVAGTTIDTGEE